jgi:hypothetical protein
MILFWINISITMASKVVTHVLIILSLAGGITLVSCGGSKPGSSSAPATATQSSPAPTPKTGFEADLDYVRKGQYTYVWVFSRKDGQPLDKNDGAYLRTNAPQVVDWVTTDQGKRVIAGTNFDLAKGNLELLKKRFVVEDYTAK